MSIDYTPVKFTDKEFREQLNNGEDVDYMNTKGFEMVRSDVADVTVEAQEFLRDQILTEDNSTAKENCYVKIREILDEVESGNRPLEEVGTRSGIGQQLSEYGDDNRTPNPLVRGAKYANQNIEGEHITTTSKPLKFPIKRIIDDDLPETYSAETKEDGEPVDYISVEDPSSLKGKVVIDYERIANRQIRERIRQIMTNVGWDLSAAEHSHEQVTLDGMM